MKEEIAIWLGIMTLAVVITVPLILGGLSWGAAVFVLVGLITAHRIGELVSSTADRRWLPSTLTLAYLAHLMGAWIHHFFVTVVYQTGDSLAYHGAALNMVADWREFQVPVAPGGSPGTRFVEVVTSLIYVPSEPSLLVGYLVFTSLGFLGTIFLYLAFRTAVPTAHLRRYALLLFFLPSMLYWPSTIGKEALMLLAIGLASYGVAALLSGGRVRGLIALAVGVSGAASIRPHVAVMVVAALVVALVLSRNAETGVHPGTRAVIGLLTLVALWSLSSLAMTRLGLGGETGIDEFLVEQERHTLQGGSAVVGSPVRSPVDIPEAALRVLFRPLPHEAHNPQAVLSALEGVALLGLLLWRLPAAFHNRRLLLSNPYLLFSLAFVAQFVVAFSSIFNLGILARQRTQALPFLLALVVALGWSLSRADESDDFSGSPVTARHP